MHLLWVANFGSDTGYAWETIEAVFRRVGERLVRDGHRVTVCYASLRDGPPARMRGAPFEFTAYDHLRGGARGFARLLAERGVDALYLTDHPTWSLRYARYRLAGVRRIIVHDRTSGERTPRGRFVQAIKRALHHLPGLSADCVVAVSDYVRQRLMDVNGAPPERTHRVYNGIDLARFGMADRALLHRELGLPADARIVFCSGRAQPYKGIQVAIEAAALLQADGVSGVHLAYAGDGAYVAELRALVEARGLRTVHFLGKRADVAALLGSAAVAVVPSLWAEAFGLTVVEAMAAGVPLVASRTGGIPELVEEGRTGILVPPGDARALADAIRLLLAHPSLRASMGLHAQIAAQRRFSLERAAVDLYALVSSQLSTAGIPAGAKPRPALPI